ncbi:MAG: hypothetical protein U9N73_00895 [Candidatus Auribacterota bacterium]|nr:hypothetical protein [Candidatus Auribacterota bacterium]
MISILKKLFGPGERVTKLAKEIEEQKNSINKFLEEYDPIVVPYCSLRKTACQSCGVLYWQKDKHHRYLTANEIHCNIFFDLSYKETKTVVGKTDIELITELRKHKSHTFGELCVSSDEYIKKQYNKTHVIKPIRFFELGYKNNVPLLLDVTKIVTIDDNKAFNGTHGHAMDWSARSEEIMELLTILLKKKLAIRLDDGGGQKVACYLIKDRRQNECLCFPDNIKKGKKNGY